MTVKEIFAAYNKLNILVLGDVMIDRYVRGSVNRISPEAPVPVLHFQSEENRPGGAANVALNLTALGATPILLSIIGQDEQGSDFLSLLAENKLTNQGIIRSAERQTTTKTRVISGSQQLLRVDREDTFGLTEKEEKKILERLDIILENQKIDAVIFQDYNKGVLSLKLIQAVISLVKSRNIPIAVDPKKKNFWAYEGVDLFKPNLKEIRESLSTQINTNLDSLRVAGTTLRNRLQNNIALITLSEHGLYYDSSEEFDLVPTRPRNIRDVCGAGDTVISVAACGLAIGLSPRQIAVQANLAGGLVCEIPGVVPINKESLKAEYTAYLKEKK